MIDILIEIFLDVYMELMLLIVPEEKRSKRHYVWVKVVAIFILLAVFALAIWGVVWIVDYDRAWGWLPLGLAIVLSLVQIISGIVLCMRKHKKD